MDEVWSTWHDEKFNCSKYLYHYTNIEKACKILFHKNLRFSFLSKTNDTAESKIKLEFMNDGKIENFIQKTEIIRNYMKNHNEFLQLLCFSMDEERIEDKKVFTKKDDKFFVDMSGRGFALPRMWAQYADNNCGVCLIINKENFESELARNYGILKIYYNKVFYKDAFASFSMPVETIDNLSHSIKEDSASTVSGYRFLKEHPDFVKYSYFTKYMDWMNEKEYRYLISSDNKNAKEIKNIYRYLEGVVVGEKIDSVDEWLIYSLVEKLNKQIIDCDNKEQIEKKKIEVKKICFDYNCINLK